MNLDPGIVVAVALPLLGLAATWGALGARIRHLEKEIAKVEPLQTLTIAIDSKVETARRDQGKRLGDTEADIAILKGRFEGFQTGFGAGRRSRTAAHGVPKDLP